MVLFGVMTTIGSLNYMVKLCSEIMVNLWLPWFLGFICNKTMVNFHKGPSCSAKFGLKRNKFGVVPHKNQSYDFRRLGTYCYFNKVYFN